MSKPMKKKMRIFLIALAVIVLLGACFGSVALYAQREINKPRFTLPEAPIRSLSELPAEKSDAVSYVRRLYESAVQADDVEASWHTDVKVKDFESDMIAPFAKADQNILFYIRENASDQLRALYPDVSGVTQSKNAGVFAFDLTEADVLDFTAAQGRYKDDSEYVDDQYYFITLTVDPARVDTEALKEGEVCRKFTEIFAPALTVSAAEIEAREIKMVFKILRAYDQLVSLEITRGYQIRVLADLTDDYAALLTPGSGESAEIEFPYVSTEKISFDHYRAHFTRRNMAVNPGDMKALPADIKVKTEATKEDYTLTFEVSQDGVLEIDEDGVMTVLKMTEEPVTILMTLTYDGHTYTDSLTIYITELEVETNG